MNGCACGMTSGCVNCNPNGYLPLRTFPGVPVWPAQGWVCPRCTRVYGPSTLECWSCNSLINNGIGRPGTASNPSGMAGGSSPGSFGGGMGG